MADDSGSDPPDIQDAEQLLSGGLAGSCKSARHGLGFPASNAGAVGTPRPYLPPDIVRLIDALVRAMEREAILYAMNGGNLGLTLRSAAEADGLLDARFLLSVGADAGAEGGWALYEACERGHLQVAEALLDARGTITPLQRNESLWLAASSGRTACCELMLERGADIHFSEDKPLQSAALFGNLDMVAFLLDRGADAWSEQAMRYATEHHHDAVVALLLARRRGEAAQ